MQPIKWYNLTKGDRAKHNDEILTFHRPDGSYIQWRDAEGMTRIGQSDEYVLGDDGIYIPYIPEVCQQKGDHSNDGVSIDELKTSISIETVIESYGIKIPSSRMNLPCPLPDHKDGTPSFSINKAHNLFKCFGCNKGGTQIDFIQNMEQCDIKTAIIKFKTYASNNQP